MLLGSFQLQPSEFVKLASALLLAKVFSESNRESLGLRDIALARAGGGGARRAHRPQPDLGSAVCLLPPFLTVAFLAGLRMRAVVAAVPGPRARLSGTGLALPEGLSEDPHLHLPRSLPRSARRRLSQDPVPDRRGLGGALGKGFGEGSQAQLGYLPARHTDFIFSVLAEETGFVGVVAVLGLYLLWLWRMLETAQLARDRLGAFLCAALAAGFAFQVVYNSAMVAGLVPVKGLPLPLLSSGGSSVLASLISVGLVLNVRMRRFAN